jgi:hypothetical protein
MVRGWRGIPHCCILVALMIWRDCHTADAPAIHVGDLTIHPWFTSRLTVKEVRYIDTVRIDARPWPCGIQGLYANRLLTLYACSKGRHCHVVNQPIPHPVY